jgi:hypothetical protein
MAEQTSNQSNSGKRRVSSGKRRLVKVAAAGLVALPVAFGLTGIANAAVIGSVFLENNEGNADADPTGQAAIAAALNACKQKYGDRVLTVEWKTSQGGLVNYDCQDATD